MQFFKGDAGEVKMYESGKEIMELLINQLNAFKAGAYECFPLGDMIHEGGFAPLANAIPQEIFRETFPELFASFRVAGTYESYISVFKKIFGDDVQVTFNDWNPPEAPAQTEGKLKIDITASGVQVSDFVARMISGGEYVFDEVVDDEGNNIVFQTVKGFQSQYELEQMLKEMVPAGIFTVISLTVGGE